MRIDTLVLLLIVLNVAAAALKRRRRKAADQPAPPRSGEPETSPAEATSADRADREGRTLDWESREGVTAAATAPKASQRTEPPATLGKDLLDQLARELGLKIPPAPPAPGMRLPAPSAPSRPQPKPIPELVTRAARREEAPTPAPRPAGLAVPAVTPLVPLTPVTRLLPVPTSGTAAPAAAAVAIGTARAPAPDPRRFCAGLRDLRSLREAVMLKEILDRPVALRRF